MPSWAQLLNESQRTKFKIRAAESLDEAQSAMEQKKRLGVGKDKVTDNDDDDYSIDCTTEECSRGKASIFNSREKLLEHMHEFHHWREEEIVPFEKFLRKRDPTSEDDTESVH